MKKSGVTEYNLSKECRACKRIMSNGGACAGHPQNSIPCLAFERLKGGGKGA